MRLLAVVAAVVACVLVCPAVAEDSRPGAPALVVLITVDQLRRDRLDPALPGGLGRLAREGQVHTEAVLDHAVTSTCPGHASIASGRHPGPAGVPANLYIDPGSGDRRYCVEDHAPDAAVFGLEGEASEGRSPRALRTDTLGDWLKAADPAARVFAVSAKDRSAIPLGGRRPDAAYWLRRNQQPGFTTSRYYRARLPDWVRAWNEVGLADRTPSEWVHAGAPAPELPNRVDDYPGEDDDRSRTSPHPLHASDPEDLADNVYASPFVDALTLSFAEQLSLEESLGAGPGTDLLAISLSGLDTVGHAYGPWSLESRDALERLDGWLGRFLEGLEARTAERGGLLVALSADHGVLPLPEWLAETGALSCPQPDGRPGLVSLVAGLWWELHVELSPFSLPRPWLNVAQQLTVDRELAADRDVPVERVVEVAERWLEARPTVREAWTREEIARGEGQFARLYRNSFDPEKSGDLAVQFEPTCMPGFFSEGTGHGSPYLYDRAVPLVFWGRGIAPARVAGEARTVDIAPSLAAWVGLDPPEGLDGRSLLDPRARETAGGQAAASGVPPPDAVLR